LDFVRFSALKKTCTSFLSDGIAAIFSPMDIRVWSIMAGADKG
jgi:hypothetical protein